MRTKSLRDSSDAEDTSEHPLNRAPRDRFAVPFVFGDEERIFFVGSSIHPLNEVSLKYVVGVSIPKHPSVTNCLLGAHDGGLIFFKIDNRKTDEFAHTQSRVMQEHDDRE